MFILNKITALWRADPATNAIHYQAHKLAFDRLRQAGIDADIAHEVADAAATDVVRTLTNRGATK